MIFSFCGHADFSGTAEYEKRILDFLEKRVGDTEAEMHLGGYGGFDQFAYECCKKYKKAHPKIRLIYVTPYMTVEYQKKHLSEAQGRYDGIIYPAIEEKPLRYAILERNKCMVEMADCIICAVTHCFGGAYQMYCYAKRKKKEIYNITGKEI